MRKCVGKVRHETRDDAKKAVRTLVENRNVNRSSLNIYRCDQCGGFHVGNTYGGGRRQRGRQQWR